jgi:hypothetical protein
VVEALAHEFAASNVSRACVRAADPGSSDACEVMLKEARV